MASPAGILGNLLGGGAGQLLNGVSKVINSIKGKSPEDAAALEQLQLKYSAEFQLAQVQAAHEELQANVQGAQMQADVNKIEAASDDMFVAGWRPFIGWVCGSGLAYQFIFAPLMTWIADLLGKHIVAPTLDLGTLVTLLLGMLGLGGMRTFEKTKGASAVGTGR